MNKEDRENIQQAVSQIIFGLTDEQTLDGLKAYCTQYIKDYLEESKEQALREIEKSKETCRMWAHEASSNSYSNSLTLSRMKDVVQKGENICSAIEQSVSKYETIKRMADEVTNNAIIDGFECSACGCIVKNININGKWIKNVRFCPNCGGENINYTQNQEHQQHYSPFANRRL